MKICRHVATVSGYPEYKCEDAINGVCKTKIPCFHDARHLWAEGCNHAICPEKWGMEPPPEPEFRMIRLEE